MEQYDIIVTLNDKKLAGKCFESLIKSGYKPRIVPVAKKDEA